MMTEMTAPAWSEVRAGPHAPTMPVHHPHRRRRCRRSRPPVAARATFSLISLQLVSFLFFFAVRTELPSRSSSFAEAFLYSHVHRRHAPDSPAFARSSATTASTVKTVTSFGSQSSVVLVTRTTRRVRAVAKLRDDDEAGEEEVRTLEFTLPKHKPLGCTVEESLATSDACSVRQQPDGGSAGDKPPVFVTKLVEGGNAAEAGIEVGDVLVGLSGVFDDVQDVSGVGIEKIRALVAGKRPDEPLVLRVLRGTDVMERHEDALVDLCTLPGGTDDTLDACVDAIMSSDVIVDEEGLGGEELEPECGEDDAECLVDDLYRMWGEEMPPPPPLVDDEAGPVNGANGDASGEDGGAPRKEVAPWSSRSSPSGTYARNPATGKLERID